MNFDQEKAPNFKQQLMAVFIDKKPKNNNGLLDVDQHILFNKILDLYNHQKDGQNEIEFIEEISNSTFEELKEKYWTNVESEKGKTSNFGEAA